MDTALIPISENAATPLTPKEELFVNLYVGEAGFNGSEAVRRAGYSEHSARQTAWELLQKPHIRAQIDAYLAEAGVTRERLLTELTRVAYAPWENFVQVKFGQNDANGQPRIIDARMDLGAKIDAIELLGRELGMFNKKVEVDLSFVPKRIIGVNLDDL